LLHLMKYTLWRNDVLLGHVHIAFPSADPAVVGGMFHPSADFLDIGPLMQARMDHLPGRPVLHHAVLERQSRDRPIAPAQAAPLRRLSAQEARGIEPTRVLELRESQGTVLCTDVIAIQRVDARENTGALATACQDLGIPFSPWYVIARLSGAGSEEAG
jgi:hypothetical protein